MSHLLDTHTLIWLLDEPEKLSKTASLIIRDNNSKCYVSIASLWEISIKVGLKKLDLKISFDSIQAELEKNSFQIIHINFLHLKKYIELPLLHKDPFDRILIVQALSFDLTIITKDALITQYNVQTIW